MKTPLFTLTTALKTIAVLALVFSTGCASGIKRSNYRFAEGHDANSRNQRQVAIKSYAKYDPEDVEVLGVIKAFDTGISTKCDEFSIVTLFCNEARVLGADFVNITEEKAPDRWSSCYRAKAEFLRYKDRTKVRYLASDVKYEQYWMLQRTEQAKRENQERMRDAMIQGAIGGAVGGVIGGAAGGR